MKDVSVIMAPPLSMGVFAYPHREGARLTLETLLGIMDGEVDPGVKEYNIVVKKGTSSITCAQCTESEDQLPGIDTTHGMRCSYGRPAKYGSIGNRR